MSQRVYLLVGTHKGGFVLSSGLERRRWETSQPFLKDRDVNHVVADTRSNDPILYACANSSWFGPDIHMSRDWGESWEQPETPTRFSESGEDKVTKVWCVVPGPESQPRVLYAGVAPAALFKSEDGGRNWAEVEALSRHSTREKWTPGAGGLMVHCICPHPSDPDRVHVGISAAGTFSSEDGGKTWEARNRGVRAEFLPEKYPEVGQCVHHMQMHPARPEVLYQQNHDGVYRSDDEGRQWTDLSGGLPSRFGFPVQIHPQDPDTVYVVPEEGAEFRCPVDGEFAVYRSRDRGQNWEKLTRGLPAEPAYLNVYRQAMTADGAESCGIYVGTSTGQIFFSRNSGDSWELLRDCLPPIFSLTALVH